MVKSGQNVVAEFVTSHPSTGAATDADSLPTAVLTVDGVDDAATVTVTNVGTGRYKAAVTLPTLTAGQCVAIVVVATVNAVDGSGVVWQDVADTVALSDLATAAAIALVKVKTDTIGALSVTVTSPVAESGVVTIYQGDDYDETHGRELSFLVADSTHALGLDDVTAVVKFKCSQATWTATDVTSTADGYTVTFEPDATETALLTHQTQGYELEATLSDGDVCTLASGELTTVIDI